MSCLALPNLKVEFALTNGEIGLNGGAAPVGMIIGAALAWPGRSATRPRILEQTLTPFRAPKRRAPGLLQKPCTARSRTING